MGRLKRAIKHATLFATGGSIYYGVEVLWRGHSHWTMAVLGGLCFLLLGAINEVLSWDTPLWRQALYGAVIITALELAAGVILNLAMGLDIWDYSSMPCNFLGQICLPYFLLWIPLSILAILLDDWLRHWFFGEERPHYRLI